MMFAFLVLLFCLLCHWVFTRQVELTRNNNNVNSSSSTGLEFTSSVNSTAADEMELIQTSSSGNSSALPCIDKLKEELSCAICLEICFMPSTTPCGHSFCRKCLQYAADKCGKKCPGCRQSLSNESSYAVCTVLWNAIQLLFPQEIERRKVAASTLNNGQAAQSLNAETTLMTNLRNRATRRNYQTPTFSSSVRMRARRGISNLDEDIVFAQRSQRENLRATTTRATNLRVRAPWRY